MRTAYGAAYWASAIINGDRSGLNDEECKLLDAWLAKELADGEEIVDVGEPHFSWGYGFYTGDDIRGGDIAEYMIINRKE